MDDPRLAAALLTSSPDALAGLFDAYGDRLFRYCWSMLRSRELAQVALRDTLLVAQAHIARLADPEDPESLGPWLYSLARAECRRHQAQSPASADESPARLGLPAADARLMSWNAAMSLEAAEFEALDLACRHYVDLGQVLGLPAAAAEDLLDRGRQQLERALGAEILACRGPACPDRDAVLADLGLAGPGDQRDPGDQPGPVTAEVRERVLKHADGCAACGPEVPRNVSATRIFALLPAPALTPQDRTEILAALAGHVPPPLPPWPRPRSSRPPQPAPRPPRPSPRPPHPTSRPPHPTSRPPRPSPRPRRLRARRLRSRPPRPQLPRPRRPRRRPRRLLRWPASAGQRWGRPSPRMSVSRSRPSVPPRPRVQPPRVQPPRGLPVRPSPEPPASPPEALVCSSPEAPARPSSAPRARLSPGTPARPGPDPVRLPPRSLRLLLLPRRLPPPQRLHPPRLAPPVRRPPRPG